MTFEAYETSARSGKPTHLFVFQRQSVVWRFAGCDRNVMIGGNAYLSAAISRSEIKQTIEKAQDNITITLPYSLDPNAAEQPVTQAFGNNWRPFVPSDPISVTCMAVHLDDPDQETEIEWVGFVQQPKFSDGQLELTCAPPGAISKAMYQGAKWQVPCWKTVYSTGTRGCGLIAGPIPVVGTVTAVNGSQVTAAAWTAQQRTFVGGTASWVGNPPESATVTALSGSTATFSNVTELAVGATVTWPGGGGVVTAIAANVVTLSSVAALAANATAKWVGDATQAYTANITAASGTTLTLDNVAGIAVNTQVTANTTSLLTQATISAVNGLQLTAAAFASAPFNLAGGSLSWTDATGIVEQRSIMAHAGSTITVLYGATALAVGLEVTAQPGCARTWSACAAFNNTVNYGGSMYKPIASPYGGKSMSWG